MAPDLKFAGAVLAGGRSQRMGTDKALIEIDGVAMALRVAHALTEAGADDVVVVGGNHSELAGLGLAVVPDLHPGDGPLGAIITALEHFHDADAVAVLSCDLTAPNPTSIRAMIGAFGTADAVVPVSEGHRQWHHTAWRPAARHTLAARFDAGERAPRRAVDRLSVVDLHDSSPCWYHDADHPDDLPG